MLYDFWYSAKQVQYIKELKAYGYHGLTDTESRLNGEVYTEAIRHGRTPVTNHFGDLILVGTAEDYGQHLEHRDLRG